VGSLCNHCDQNMPPRPSFTSQVRCLLLHANTVTDAYAPFINTGIASRFEGTQVTGACAWCARKVPNRTRYLKQLVAPRTQRPHHRTTCAQTPSHAQAPHASSLLFSRIIHSSDPQPSPASRPRALVPHLSHQPSRPVDAVTRLTPVTPETDTQTACHTRPQASSGVHSLLGRWRRTVYPFHCSDAQYQQLGARAEAADGPVR
jgi:hypothetical protein